MEREEHLDQQAHREHQDAEDNQERKDSQEKLVEMARTVVVELLDLLDLMEREARKLLQANQERTVFPARTEQRDQLDHKAIKVVAEDVESRENPVKLVPQELTAKMDPLDRRDLMAAQVTEDTMERQVKWVIVAIEELLEPQELEVRKE